MKSQIFLLTLLTFVMATFAGNEKINLGISTMKPVKVTLATKKTTTMETETTTESKVCIHEWKKYDAVNDPQAPTRDGFFVENYYDGSPMYLGIGNNSALGLVYGRLNINASYSKPGVYSLGFVGGEEFDNTETAEYLVKNPRYFYKWVRSKPNEVRHNAVQMKPENYTFIASRINVLSFYGFEYYAVGITIKGIDTFYYNPEQGYYDYSAGNPVDILTCSTTKIIDEKIPEPEGLCTHTWKSYDPKTDPLAPTIDGVFGGYYANDTVIYVGKGNDSRDGIVFGQIIVNGTQQPGFYSAFGKKVPDTSEKVQYLVNNPNNTYFWYKTNQSYDKYVANDIHMKLKIFELTLTRANITLKKTQKKYTTIGMTVNDAYFNEPTYYYDYDEGYTLDLQSNESVDVLLCTTTGSMEPIRRQKPKTATCINEWVEYSPREYPLDPEKRGIFAGYYHDGAPIYVGRGYNEWNGITPGRATVKGSYKPGVYTLDGFDESFDNHIMPGYLLNNIDYDYEWMTIEPKSAPKVIIETAYDGFDFAVARINITHNGQIFTQITKTFIDIGTWYWDPILNKTVGIGMTELEILVCTPK